MKIRLKSILKGILKQLKERFFQKDLKKKDFKKFGKYSFIIWIAYQTIKGSITTFFIWIPLIYHYFLAK